MSSSGTLALVALETDTGALVAITRADEAWKVSPAGHRTPPGEQKYACKPRTSITTERSICYCSPLRSILAIPPDASVWLSNGAQKFTLLPVARGSPRVFDVADLNGDGRLDLLGLSPHGEPQQSSTTEAKSITGRFFVPEHARPPAISASTPSASAARWSYASGLLVQKQAITAPQLHFGLGEQTSTDVVRILWPNGMQNAEFALKANQEMLTEQRLKGSCPFLFAWNGKQMSFVKDAVPWGSAIGLQIDSVGSPGIAATEEWYKIGGDQLAPHDGYYDLRLTGELWETYYYDYLKLMVVDHPAGTEIFTDERFVVPAPKPAITTVAPPHPIAKAIDDQGADVTAIVSNLDGNYLDTFGRGQYQGLPAITMSKWTWATMCRRAAPCG